MTERIRNFTFGELSINLDDFSSLLGFPGMQLPEPFDAWLGEALDFASGQTEIMGASVIAEPAVLNPGSGTLMAGGREFSVGKTICKELRGIEKVMIFAGTAGQAISRKAASLMGGEDPAKGFLYDQLGSFMAESVSEQLQKIAREESALVGMTVTNRYSPGHCQWSVADQPLLFSFFSPGICGITLTESALMNPVKSISGIIGIGREVRFRDYPCDLCPLLQCHYRKKG